MIRLSTSAIALSALLAMGCGETDEPGKHHETPGKDAGSPVISDEAGFFDIEPVAHTFLGKSALTASAHRLFYVFQAADEDAAHKPLVVFFNGGPGSTSEILFGFNTAKRTVDRRFTGGAAVADNPASWSRFANLLYVDAPNTGFSYARMIEPTGDPAVAFSDDDYNVGVDAAQMVRGVLRFLDSHEALRAAPVVLAGESYGGVRAVMMLLEILTSASLRDDGSIYQDARLADEIDAHFKAIYSDADEVTPEIAARQFGAQVLLEPAIAINCTLRRAPLLLNQPGSPLFDVAKQLREPFMPCKAPCSEESASASYHHFIDALHRNAYDIRESGPESDVAFYESMKAFAQIDSLRDALGVDPATIEGLSATDRQRAFRYPPDFQDPEAATAIADQGSLTSALGTLGTLDRYFMADNGSVRLQASSNFGEQVFASIFVYTTLHVRTFVTQARYDTVVYGPALQGCLEDLPEIDHVTVDPGASPREGTMTLQLLAETGSPVIRFPMYDRAGHTVSMRQPVELRDDVEAWLSEGP